MRRRVSGGISGSYAINSGKVMRATIDETLEFEQKHLEVGSYHRDSAERSVTGLDGMLSIDLGMRGRQLVQEGVLRAVSIEGLREKEVSFSNLVDGQTHTVALEDRRRFDNLRVDSLKIINEGRSGAGPWCIFEIKYTQLTI